MRGVLYFVCRAVALMVGDGDVAAAVVNTDGSFFMAIVQCHVRTHQFP